MADADVPITAGTGTKIDTRTVGAGADEHRQVVVVGDPATAAGVAGADAANGLDVDVTRVQGTVAVSGPVTDAQLRATAVPVSGPLTDAQVRATALPVSAASLPLPAGASTAAKQPALGTAGTASADVLSVQGVAAMTALKVDGSAVTQPVSGTVTATGPLTDAQIRATALPVSGTVTANAGTGTFTTKETRASTPAQTSPAMSNVSASILALNANRLGATIYNEGTADVLVKLGATASTTSYSVKVLSGGYYELPFSFTGAIDGITASGTATLRVTELTA